VVFDKGDIALAMRASMAVPAIFAAVEVDGVTLVDGGIADNLPIDVVRKMGADTLLSHLLPLPPGEGWGEGIKSSQLPDFLSPHPGRSRHPASRDTCTSLYIVLLPEGEGTHCLYSDV